MLQLQILSGKKAGTEFASSRFPVQIGRSPTADLSLDEPGVWERHFQILFTPGGLLLKTLADAPVTINDQQSTEAILRNGDLIGIGLLKIRFGLSPVRQYNSRVREWLTWIGLAALCLAQVALIYRLLRA